jgi:RNA polymerase sigma-70 factor (ECF subfamily)
MAVMSEPIVEERTETFEDFFLAHHERLLRTMYLATGDRHEAEDLTQEAFVRILERWEWVHGLEDPVGYLFRTALNAHRSRLRRLSVAARKALRPEPGTNEQEAAEDRTAVHRALAALPDGQREAVVLVEWLGMTDERAGAVLGVSAGAVRTRLHRARTALRELLRGEIDA